MGARFRLAGVLASWCFEAMAPPRLEPALFSSSESRSSLPGPADAPERGGSDQAIGELNLSLHAKDLGEGSALAALHLLLKNPPQRAVEDLRTRAWMASLTATAGYEQHCRSEIVMRRARALSRPPAPTIGAAHRAPAHQDAANNLGGVERADRKSVV